MARPLVTVRPLANARYAVDAQRRYAAVNASGAVRWPSCQRRHVSVMTAYNDNGAARFLPMITAPRFRS